jgi:peptidoglycan/LPS O-acetylase OafA/YrhL
MLLVRVDSETKSYFNVKYRPDIDGLRAVAVLLVVWFHAFPQLVKGGFIGVDIFFVISGFLISSIIFTNLEHGSFSLVEFYDRRIRRIFPALLLILTSCAVAGWYLLSEGEYAALGKDISGGAGFVSNLVLWGESGYFDRASDSKPLLHLWSLGIEEQFYLFWPLTLWLAWKRKWNAAHVTGAVAALSFVANIAFIGSYPTATFYAPATRVWELLMGAGLAQFSQHAVERTSTRGWIRHLLGAAGFLTVAVAAALLDSGKPFPGWWAVLPATGAILIIYAGPQSWLNKWLLSNRVMVGIGLISYPLYLWHWPLLSFLRMTEVLKDPTQIGICAVAGAFALSGLTYRFVEKPLRHNYQERSAGPVKPRRMLSGLSIGLLAGIILLFSSGLLIFFAGGKIFRQEAQISALPPLPDPGAFQELKIFEHWMRPDTSCQDNLHWSALLPEEVCVANSSKPKVLFLGDSHAMALYSAIFARHVNIPSALVASPGCLFYPNLTYKPKNNEWGRNCTQITQKGLELARSMASIDTVVIANVRKENYADRLTQFYLGDTALTDHAAFTSGTEDLIAALLAMGKRVIYVMDVPYFPDTPQSCQTRYLRTQTDDCIISQAKLDGAFGQYFVALKAIKEKFPKLEIFDARNVVCAKGTCSQHDGAQYLYIDKDHLSVYGSEQALKKMAAQVPLD